MKTKDVLIAARKKIERPEYWTKGDCARDKSGDAVKNRSPEAVCWCALGALFASTAPLQSKDAVIALYDALGERRSVACFNDDPNTTHTDVLALFDRAIAACKEE